MMFNKPMDCLKQKEEAVRYFENKRGTYFEWKYDLAEKEYNIVSGEIGDLYNLIDDFAENLCYATSTTASFKSLNEMYKKGEVKFEEYNLSKGNYVYSLTIDFGNLIDLGEKIENRYNEIAEIKRIENEIESEKIAADNLKEIKRSCEDELKQKNRTIDRIRPELQVAQKKLEKIIDEVQKTADDETWEKIKSNL